MSDTESRVELLEAVLESHASVLAFHLAENIELTQFNRFLLEQDRSREEHAAENYESADAYRRELETAKKIVQNLEESGKHKEQTINDLTENQRKTEELLATTQAGLKDYGRREQLANEKIARLEAEIVEAQQGASKLRQAETSVVSAEKLLIDLNHEIEQLRRENQVLKDKLELLQATSSFNAPLNGESTQELVAANQKLRDRQRKAATHLTRAVSQWEEDPGKSLRSLGFAVKLLPSAVES